MATHVEPVDLSALLRRTTREVHARAERSGIVADMLRGRVSRYGYGLFLRGLLPAYQRMEAALESLRSTPGVGELARPEVYRADAIESDLNGLYGSDWAAALPLSPAAARYAERIVAAAQGQGHGLIGHAYVRYLGDLSGGQVLKRRLAQSLGLGPQSLSFYDFPAIDDLTAYKEDFRAALDRAASLIGGGEAVADAAMEAFALNIEVSEAARAMAAP